MIFYIILTILLFSFIIYPLIVFYFIYKKSVFKDHYKAKYNLQYDSKICAFFHPTCYGGGGGERVLWEAIKVIQKRFPKIFCVIYCKDTNLSDIEILENVTTIFSIKIENPVSFVRLKYCRFLEPQKYKRFTMIGQSLGSMIVAMEALLKCVPHVYFDTVGYAFTLPVFKVLALCQTAVYIHYPTISNDMLTNVARGDLSFNNQSIISESKFLTALKLHYYRSFALFYSLMGKAADCVMVNSSWTKGHVLLLWGGRPSLVYPPCDVDKIEENLDYNDSTGGELVNVAARRSSSIIKRQPWILSVGQFRAEKNHLLQLESFKYYLDNCKSRLHRSYDPQEVKLLLIGGCRNVEDSERMKKLQSKCVELDIEDRVKFKCNINHREMVKCFQEALIAVHTMKDEHFGIAIVECMSAGLVTVANNSAGPKLDIIDHGKNGFLASSCEEYGILFDQILSKPSEYWENLRTEAKLKSRIFSSHEFALSFTEAIKDLFN